MKSKVRSVEKRGPCHFHTPKLSPGCITGPKSAIAMRWTIAVVAICIGMQCCSCHHLAIGTASAFSWLSTSYNGAIHHCRHHGKVQQLELPLLHAKRKRREQESQDMDLFSRWYDRVDQSATPDHVFWEEMERQRRIGGAVDSKGAASGADATTLPSESASGGPLLGGGNVSPFSPASSTTYSTPTRGHVLSSQENMHSPESILAKYQYASMLNNYIGDDFNNMDSDDFGGQYDQEYEMSNEELELEDLELEAQLDELLNEQEQQEEQGEGEETIIGEEWNEPEIWDDWAGEGDNDSTSIDETTTNQDKEEDEEEHRLQQVQQQRQRQEQISLSCPRLEKARNSINAAQFFSRSVNSMEGYDTMWISAIEDQECLPNLIGVFRDYGIQFADNFDSWKIDQRLQQRQQQHLCSIEDIASFKARKVYEITRLPCIASRTSFEIEPIRQHHQQQASNGRLSPMNPRIASGYRFNHVGEHVDKMISVLQPASDPLRMTQFRSVFCYYDGKQEIFDYGECDCAMGWATSGRALVPMSIAIRELSESLKLVMGLQFQTWINKKTKKKATSAATTLLHEEQTLSDDGGRSMDHQQASLKLRDRILRDGRVLPNEIIDVSAFMDSMVDVNLMEECGEELSQRFISARPTKILTVATTGLVIAVPMAKYLQIPCVYARKERNVVMAATFQAGYSSKTVGKNRELLVSKDHIDPDDRILIVDDFLSSGSSQEALFRIVSDAEAEVVGVGVLIEKVYDSGRQFLSGIDAPVESMVRILSVKGGIISLAEEDGVEAV